MGGTRAQIETATSFESEAVPALPSNRPYYFRLAQLLRRPVVLNSAVALFGCLSALILFEVFFRVTTALYPPKQAKPDRPAFYYAPEESRKAQDYAYPLAKPANTFRVAVIGDSFTYPTYLQFDDAFPKRLERMLNLGRMKEDRRRAEVLNFGRMGASTRSEIGLVKKALAYQPDLVLLEITLNDPEPRNFHQYAAKHPERYTSGELRIDAESHPLLSHWKSLVYLLTRVHNARTHSSLLRYYDDIYNDEDRWNEFSGAIDEIHHLAARSGARLGAVVFPFFYFPIDDRYPFRQLHDRIHRLLDRKPIPYTDLEHSFADVATERLHVMVGKDSHPNEIAHRIAAESIYLWLEEEKLIPDDLVIRRRAEDRRVLRKKRHPNEGRGH